MNRAQDLAARFDALEQRSTPLAILIAIVAVGVIVATLGLGLAAAFAIVDALPTIITAPAATLALAATARWAYRTVANEPLEDDR